ncbi:MAG: glycerol-3-phosphate 1-O-acyltransferase PlsY [Chlorobi bacterium]|nr:glycerol-3-phosphate 1-O-acyltransferase PlsY [Chlorobiota bacterium]
MYLLSFIILLSYMVGSIPTALIIGRLKGIDIRSIGSGNMGSTNVIRALGFKWGMVVQVLDILKGLVAVLLIARLHYGDIPFTNRTPFDDFTLIQIIAGISAVAGHIWSAFARFRGGKGINTSAGMLLGIAPIDISIAILVFLIVLMTSGYVSLGSILAAISLPATIFLRFNVFHAEIPGYHTLIVFCSLIAVLLVYTHRSNIKRLLHGQENRFEKIRIFSRRTR